MELEAYDVTKSYLDMARSVTDTQLSIEGGLDKDSKFKNDASFGLVSCAYVYSYMAITAFVSVHLHEQWKSSGSKLKAQYPSVNSFENLMKSNFKEIKPALNKLSELCGIERHHEKAPKVWQHLNEFLKNYRDFFVHPTPVKFNEVIEGAFSKEWSFAPNTAIEVIGYYYDQLGQSRPNWLGASCQVYIPEIKIRFI